MHERQENRRPVEMHGPRLIKAAKCFRRNERTEVKYNLQSVDFKKHPARVHCRKWCIAGAHSNYTG